MTDAQTLDGNRTQSPNGLTLKGTLLVTSTLTVMAGVTIAPSLPAMREAFDGIPNADLLVRLVLTLPALFIAVGAPIAGYFVDKLGRKNLLVGAAVAYGVTGASGYIAPTLTTILIGRALLGVSVAVLMTSVTTLIADYYSGRQRAQFLGWQAAAMGLGGTVFLTVGGWLADIDWRAPFLIYAFAFVMLPFIVLTLYEPNTNAPTVTVTADDHPPREKAPTGLMEVGYASIILIQLVFYLVPTQLPFYLEGLVGATATQTGLAVAVMALFYAVSSMMFGWISDHIDHVTTMTLSFLLTGIGYGLIAAAGGWVLLLVGLVLGGFGIGLLMPNINSWLASEAPLHMRGRVLSGFTMSVFIGQFSSPLVGQPLIEVFGDAGLFGVVAGSLVVLAVVVALLRKQIIAITA